MTEPTSDDAGPPARASGSEHASALSEVLEDQRRREAARAAAGRPPGDRSDASFFVQVALLLSGTFFFYLLFFSPTWIAPDPAPEIAAERLDENVRFGLFLMVKQIDAFQDEEGRLPESAQEIPGWSPEVEYTRLPGEDYRISYSDGERTVSYESTQDPDEFIGDAANRILTADRQTSEES